MDKPTPGPWRVERRRHHFQIMHDQRGKGDGYNNRVAETVQWSNATGPQTGPTEAEANARLIAAAPDLLEAGEGARQALWNALDHLGFECPDAHPAIVELNAAIARATGEA